MIATMNGNVAALRAGSHGYEVAEISFSPEYMACHGVPCANNGEIIEKVIRGEAVYGVVPFKNSIDGLVMPVLKGVGDTLFTAAPLQVDRQWDRKIEQYLIGHDPGINLAGVKYVVTHEKAYGQVLGPLRELAGNPELMKVGSTSEGVEKVMALQDPQVIAVASKDAATRFGAHILMLGSPPGNRTSFWRISHNPEPVPLFAQCQTMIMLACRNVPGSLYRILAPFDRHGINNDQILSREAPDGSYIFYLGFSGNQNDPEVADALQEARQHCNYLHVLGSYPVMRI